MNRFILDFTCRNDASSSQQRRDIMAAAEREKIAHYRDMAIGLRATFVPFVTNAFGGFSPAALDFVRRMRRFGLSRDPLLTPMDVTRRMCRRIAIKVSGINLPVFESK